MSLLVTGSIGIDTVESPAGRIVDALGGSSVYFSYAAAFFSPVRFVGVVGEDCPTNFLKPLHDKPEIDMAGLEVREGSKTFRWHGRYHDDVNERDTIEVDLNVLGEEGPRIPDSFKDSKYVFLANTHPALQMQLLDSLSDSALVVADTMDLWIKTEHPLLLELIKRIDGLVLNDSEAKLLTGKYNVVEAGLEISAMLKKFCVIKKGEHGSLLFMGEKVSALPSYPTLKVVDPTGAGDSFAGAMMGHIAAEDSIDRAVICKAIAYGTVTASLGIEGFSLNRFQQVRREDIEERMDLFRDIVEF
ncbi:MAG: PfkB family carbohydrate kinase [Phycisphaerae bacterium]